MTDYKQLITRMADELDHYRQLLMDNRSEVHALATEARAALAEPEPEGPTDEEIMDVASKAGLAYYVYCMGRIREVSNPYMEGADITKEVLAFARTVLARWGNHPGSPDSSAQPS